MMFRVIFLCVFICLVSTTSVACGRDLRDEVSLCRLLDFYSHTGLFTGMFVSMIRRVSIFYPYIQHYQQQ